MGGTAKGTESDFDKSLEFSIRGKSRFLLIMAGIFSFMAFSMLFACIYRGNENIKDILVLFIIPALFIFYMRNCMIEVKDGLFVYRNGFLFKNKIPVSEIKNFGLVFRKTWNNHEQLVYKITYKRGAIYIAAHEFASYPTIEKHMQRIIFKNGFGGPYIKNLLKTLENRKKDSTDRISAIDTLYMFDAVDIENAFISVICDPSDDPDVIEECCIYLGLMWKRKNNANRDFLKQIPPELSEKIVWGMEHDITERAL